MVGLGRVELPTRSLGNCCSIHLSYSPAQTQLNTGQNVPRGDDSVCTAGDHSAMILSAHSTRPTKIAGLPNLKPHCVTSASVTPRERLHAPQANTGILAATILSNVSFSGGQPMGTTASTTLLRVSTVASPSRK